VSSSVSTIVSGVRRGPMVELVEELAACSGLLRCAAAQESQSWRPQSRARWSPWLTEPEATMAAVSRS